MAFTETDFWALIERIDRAALAECDEDKAIELVVQALQERPEADIFAFEEHLAKALYNLDGRKYADEAGDSGNSDDGFLYTRCYVVGCGKARYDAVLANPTLMPKTTDEWFETLLGVAQEAYESRQGKEWVYTPTVSYETGSNKPQW
jgi:Protein of unknown function (DUF4240)